MKKLINAVDAILAESLEGFAAAHAEIVTLGRERKFVRRRGTEAGKGGADLRRRLGSRAAARRLRGSRHAGRGLPGPGVHVADARPDGGRRRKPWNRRRLLFIVKNYEGDVMNFQMAAEMLGRDIATVIVNDDVAVENSTYTTGRRGVAGTLIVEKMVGAAAEQGARSPRSRRWARR